MVGLEIHVLDKFDQIPSSKISGAYGNVWQDLLNKCFLFGLLQRNVIRQNDAIEGRSHGEHECAKTGVCGTKTYIESNV